MEGYQKALERLATGVSLEDVLVAIVESVEHARPEMICSVLLLDSSGQHLRHGAAPSLPDSYNEAVDGIEIGPKAGSCGAAAATGERFIVADVENHENWTPYVELARSAGVRACWSQPIFSSTGEILGTFAIYYRDVREPSEEDLALIGSSAHLCGIAIERSRSDTALAIAQRDLEKMVQERTSELEAANEALEGEVAERSKAERELIEKRNLLQTVIDILPSRIFVKDREGGFLINNLAHLKLLGLRKAAEARGKTTVDFFPNDLGRQVMRDDEEVMSTGRPILNEEYVDTDDEGEKRWVITTKVPFRDSDGKVTGLAGMSTDITERKLEEQKLAQLTEELRERNDQLEADLKMAREVQLACLPNEIPPFPRDAKEGESRLAFCNRYRPATTLAGDFFDILAISDNEAGLLICDVMGHGLRASLVTTLIRGLVERLRPIAPDPAEFLRAINHGLKRVLGQTGQPIFVTAFYLVADLDNQEMLFSNAGHPSPLFVRRDAGVVERLEGQRAEPALGFLEDFEYSTWHSPLERHDLVLLYTDGIFSSEKDGAEVFGRDQLLSFARANMKLPAEELIDGLFAEIEKRAETSEFTDDVCMVTLEVVR